MLLDVPPAREIFPLEGSVGLRFLSALVIFRTIVRFRFKRVFTRWRTLSASVIFRTIVLFSVSGVSVFLRDGGGGGGINGWPQPTDLVKVKASEGQN